MKLLRTSSSLPHCGQLSSSKVLQVRAGNLDIFSIETKQEHTAEGLQGLPQMLPCWQQLCLVGSPGLC